MEPNMIDATDNNVVTDLPKNRFLDKYRKHLIVAAAVVLGAVVGGIAYAASDGAESEDTIDFSDSED